MSRTRSKSAGKLRSRVWSRESIAQHAITRSAHRLFRRFEDLEMPFISAILLRDGQRCMLTEFQRRHVEYPPLRLDEIRTVWCRVVDDIGRPLRRASGKPCFTRLFLEVAECPHTRRGGRGPWGVRKQALWFFVAWDAEGAAVQLTRCRSRKAALTMYNMPADRLGVPDSRDTGALVILPERAARKHAADSARSDGMEGAHA